MILILLIIYILILIILLGIFVYFHFKNMDINFDVYENFENSSNITSNLIPTTNEIKLPSTSISPVIQLAEELDKLKLLQKANKEIDNKNNEIKYTINTNTNLINELSDEIDKKRGEKLKLEEEISKMNFEKESHNNIAKSLITTVKTIEEKEEELKKKEIELKKEMKELEELKLKPVPELPPVTINQQQLDLLLEKLILIEKLFKEVKEKNEEKEKKNADKDVCQLYESIPQPKKDDFINDNKKDLTYLWCLCNNNMDKNVDCMEYKNCLSNYAKNKNNKTIEKEDLMLYFRCINKFPEFPKYLKDNN